MAREARMHLLTAFSLRRPAPVVALALLLSGFALAGAGQLRTEFGYRVLVGDAHPAIVASDALVRRFGGGLPVQIAWQCGGGAPCREALDATSLDMAWELTRRLAGAEDVRDVVGVANAPLLRATDAGFEVRRFFEGGRRVPDLESLREHARADPLWIGEWLSADGRTGVIRVQPVDTRASTDRRILQEIEAAIAPLQARGFRFALAGEPVASIVAGRTLAASTDRLLPFTVLAIGSVAALLLRSLPLALAALSVMGLAVLWTFGFMGALGWPKDGIHEAMAPLVLVVGVCDAMHLLSRFRAQRDAPSEAALVRAARQTGPACALTTLTTASAFLSFTASDLSTFGRFGVTAAFGSVACLVLTFGLLPILARRLAPAREERAPRQRWDRALDAVVAVSAERPRAIVIVSLGILLVFGFGWAAHLRADTRWDESFGPDADHRRWIRFIEAEVAPTDTLELELRLPEGWSLAEPRTLAVLDALARELDAVPGLDDVRSVRRWMTRLDRMLHPDRTPEARHAPTRAGNAEVLELLAFDDPALLDRWVGLDRTSVRVSARAPNQSHSLSSEILSRADAVIAEVVPDDWGVVRSGAVAMTDAWVREVQATQLRSFPIAFGVAFCWVAVLLRSPALAAAALLPTLLPVVAVLGAMGWLGLSLDIGRAMIAAIAIGIGVDDAIHLLEGYARLRRRGESARQAMEASLRACGRALVTTSLSLACGFLTLMASAWQTLSSFGFFLALAILGALVSTLLVVPALVFCFTPDPAGRSGVRWGGARPEAE